MKQQKQQTIIAPPPPTILPPKPKKQILFYLQVLKILAWDTKNHLVYYLGTLDKKPGQQHLYIVKDPLNKDNGK